MALREGGPLPHNGRRPRSGRVSDRETDPEIIPGDHIPTFSPLISTSYLYLDNPLIHKSVHRAHCIMTVVPRTNCCFTTTSHHASTELPRRSTSSENHGSGTPKMEWPPFPPSDGGLGSSSHRRNLGPGEAAAASSVGSSPWPCPLPGGA
jgi:hypothetical protein